MVNSQWLMAGSIHNARCTIHSAWCKVHSVGWKVKKTVYNLKLQSLTLIMNLNL